MGEEKANTENNLSDEYARKLKHAYAASVSYIDYQIGKVIAALKEHDLYDNSVIVLWGDHGWHLGDHRVWGKHTILEPALKSALMIKLPNDKVKEKIINTPVGSIDIYPTLNELCNLPEPPDLDGKSLLHLITKPDRQHHPILSFFNNGISMRSGNYRLTQYQKHGEMTVLLHDVQKDPCQFENLALDHSVALDELKNLFPSDQMAVFAE